MPRNPIFSFIVFLLSCGALFVFTSCTEDRAQGWRNPSSQTISNQDATINTANNTEQDIGKQIQLFTNTEKAKVALLLPLSGRGQETGEAMLNAAQLALFDLKADKYFELNPKDTGTGATNAAKEALKENSNLILGPLFADDTKAAAMIASQQNIPTISFSTDTSAAKYNTYLFGFLPQTQVKEILNYAVENGKNRIGLIAARDAYGDSIAKAFHDYGSVYNIDTSNLVRFDPQFLPNATDISRLKYMSPQMEPDAILIAAPAPIAAKISALLTSQGMPPSMVQRLGTGLWDDPAASKVSELQGAWFTAVSNQNRIGFENRYRQTYGQNPPRLASLAYDATSLAVVIAKSGHTFSDSALKRDNGFAGVDGIFRFKNDGLVERTLSIAQFKNGQIITLQSAPNSFTQ